MFETIYLISEIGQIILVVYAGYLFTKWLNK